MKTTHRRSPLASATRFRIGVDGGGSGTRVRLESADGRLLAQATAGPSGLAQGVAQAWQHIVQAIERAFQSAGSSVAPPSDCALGLGLAGAIVTPLRDAFLQAAPPYAELALDSDAYVALLGAHRGGPGVVVAAGTGSVGEALRRNGQRVSVSGWGFPVGDEGSGAWLGLRAMRRTQCAFDGRAADGALARAVRERCGSTRESLLAWCARAGQRDYAQLAPLVFDTEGDDPAAAQLLVRAVQALEDAARALDPQGDLPLVFSGSIGRRLQPRLAPALRARCVEPAGDAAQGALELLRPSERAR